MRKLTTGIMGNRGNDQEVVMIQNKIDREQAVTMVAEVPQLRDHPRTRSKFRLR